MQQNDAETRFPVRGQAWRHMTGQLYEIVGTGHDAETFAAVVVYTEFGWDKVQPPNLRVERLDRFMGEYPDALHPDALRVRRFTFEREAEGWRGGPDAT